MKPQFLFAYFFLFFIVSCSNDAENEISNTDSNFLLKKSVSNWNETDFYQVRYLQLGNLKGQIAENTFTLSEGLLIEEISEKEYNSANQQKKRFYLKDTLAFIKRNNQIKIGKTTLKDSNHKNGSYEFYSYLGFFPILNQYLIKGDYLDSLDYKLIDKNTGEVKQSLINYPIISKLGNFIAVCKTIEDEKKTYFEIYNFKNGLYKVQLKAIFTNWRVVDFEQFAFWGTDGSLYLKVDKMKDDYNLNETYVKITLN